MQIACASFFLCWLTLACWYPDVNIGWVGPNLRKIGKRRLSLQFWTLKVNPPSWWSLMWWLNSWIGEWWEMPPMRFFPGWGIILLRARRFYILQTTVSIILYSVLFYILHSIILWEYTVPAIAFRIISSIFFLCFSHPVFHKQKQQKTHPLPVISNHPSYHLPKKKRPETAPEVLFALHDPRSSRGGADDQNTAS